ncbi:MAG: amidohydrolase [Anaerolineae bacterium]|nr:amidohydrolase [Anaerolineae bacterium]
MLAKLVLTNGRFHTMDPAQPEVTAVAVRDDLIVATGGDEDIRDLLVPGGEWIDLGGRTVTPGLVDAHAHFQSFALNLQRVALHEVPSKEEALQRIAMAVREQVSGGWLLGRGWTQELWADRAFPSAADLDTVAPDVPIYLAHKSGHAAWVNSRALQLAGVGGDTADPPGGQIQRDRSGQPTGILFESAMDLVAAHIPPPTAVEVAAAMKAAQPVCWQAGLTGLHDFDGRTSFEALQMLLEAGELGLRVVKNIPVYRLDHAIGIGLRSGFGNDWLRIGGVKIFADGALGPRTAHMIAPYEGEPDSRGIAVTEKEEMVALAAEASAHGLSVTIHAIGDRANHDVLDVYEAVRRQELAASGLPNDGDDEALRQAIARMAAPLRHRIEHVQIMHPADQPRLAALGIIASMQPSHATSDMEMADRYWGERARYSYAWRSIVDSGATLVFGSDSPIEPIAPLPGIYAAVTRRRADGSPGPDGWYPEQRLSLEEAVRAFTLAAAETSGQEARQGSITPGKVADMTIYGDDIFALPPEALLNTRVDGTLAGGVFRHRSF